MILYSSLLYPSCILVSAGGDSVRGPLPAHARADQAVPHLSADVAARRLAAAQGGPARRRLRPPPGHGAARTRSVPSLMIELNQGAIQARDRGRFGLLCRRRAQKGRLFGVIL